MNKAPKQLLKVRLFSVIFEVYVFLNSETLWFLPHFKGPSLKVLFEPLICTEFFPK